MEDTQHLITSGEIVKQKPNFSAMLSALEAMTTAGEDNLHWLMRHTALSQTHKVLYSVDGRGYCATISKFIVAIGGGNRRITTRITFRGPFRNPPSRERDIPAATFFAALNKQFESKINNVEVIFSTTYQWTLGIHYLQYDEQIDDEMLVIVLFEEGDALS